MRWHAVKESENRSSSNHRSFLICLEGDHAPREAVSGDQGVHVRTHVGELEGLLGARVEENQAYGECGGPVRDDEKGAAQKAGGERHDGFSLFGVPVPEQSERELPFGAMSWAKFQIKQIFENVAQRAFEQVPWVGFPRGCVHVPDSSRA